jgi:hypothetical protein
MTSSARCRRMSPVLTPPPRNTPHIRDYFDRDAPSLRRHREWRLKQVPDDYGADRVAPRRTILIVRRAPAYGRAWLDHRKVSCPIITCGDRVGEASSHIARARHWNAEQYDAACYRQGRAHEPARQNPYRRSALLATLALPRPEHRDHSYPAPWSVPRHIVARGFEHRHGRAGKVLVGEEAHFKLRWGLPSPNSTCPEHRRNTQ